MAMANLVGILSLVLYLSLSSNLIFYCQINIYIVILRIYLLTLNYEDMYTSHLLAKKWSQEIQYVQTTDNIQRILLLLYSFQKEERSLELIEKQHCDDDGVVGFR